MKHPKHQAEQFELPVKISLHVTLKDTHARLWNAYASDKAEICPSSSQLAQALIQRGLAAWAVEKGIK